MRSGGISFFVLFVCLLFFPPLILIDSEQLSQLDRQWSRTVVSIPSFLSISLWNSSRRWWNAFEISNFEWLRPPGESDEWYPALLHPPQNKKREKTKKELLFNRVPPSPEKKENLLQHFLNIKIDLKAKQNAVNEPTRMTPLQSGRVMSTLLNQINAIRRLVSCSRPVLA